MSLSYFKTATCDICRKIFREVRKRYYCEHCKEYFYVCEECKHDDFKLKCPNCKNAMNEIGIHVFWRGSECIKYECTKCKRQWI